jgi:hypothetical protein
MAKYYEKQSKSQNAASLGSTHLAFHNNLLSIKSECHFVMKWIEIESQDNIISTGNGADVCWVSLDKRA